MLKSKKKESMVEEMVLVPRRLLIVARDEAAFSADWAKNDEEWGPYYERQADEFHKELVMGLLRLTFLTQHKRIPTAKEIRQIVSQAQRRIHANQR